jgi:alkaline phosphatase
MNWQKQSRRAFLQNGSLLMLSAGLAIESVRAQNTGENENEAMPQKNPVVKVGLLTDAHYAEKEMAINRYYRESLAKVREAADVFRENNVDFAVELGDLIDGAPDDAPFLRAINEVWKEAAPQRHCVLGNHCVARLSKTQFLDIVGQPRSFYSFDCNNFHFVVLDACFRQDGTAYDRGNFLWTDTDIPESQREWLQADLAAAKFPTILFIHQRLDLPPDSMYAVKSSPAVRAILEKSGKVLAVFQGHSHKNEHALINEIHYCTLRAVVEGSGAQNNGYSILKIFADASLQLEGFREHPDQQWNAPRKT